MTLPTPSAIQTLADTVEADTGGRSEISHVEGSRWRVTTSNDRVTMWVEYHTLSRGRLKWAQSQLFVDGSRVDRADGYADLIRIFQDPDGTNPPAEPELVDVDPATAPPAVRSVYTKIALGIARLDARLSVHVRTGGRRWVISVENEHMSLRCEFRTPLMDPLRPERAVATRPLRRPFSLTIDGQDLTEQINGRLDKALAMMAAHSAAPSPPPINGAAPAAVNDSVRVRRQSVIRV